MNVIKCCNGCEERHIGCHSSCEKYIKAKAEAAAKRDALCQAFIADGYQRKKSVRLNKRRHLR